MSESPGFPSESGGAQALIKQALQAQLAQNPKAARLVQEQGDVLQQAAPLKEEKRAKPRPDEGGKKGLLTPLEEKRMEAEPGDKPKLIPVEGVTVNGQHALDGKLSGLQVVVLRAPGVPPEKQRIYAWDSASSYYTMQTGSSSNRARLICRENLAEAQKASQAGSLLFAATISSEKDILAGASQKGSAPPPPPQPKQLQRSQELIDLDSDGGNLYVRNHFLIAVSGDFFSYLRVPDANDGSHFPWFLVINTPNNSTPSQRQAVGPKTHVLVMAAFGDYGGAASGPAELQWAGGRVLPSGAPAPATRALTVEDLPALLEGGRIHKMFTTGQRLTLIVDNRYVADFGLEVKAQPRPPATPEQHEMVVQFERALQQLNPGFRRDDALYNAAGNGAALGIVVVELGRSVHLSIMAADLQYAIGSVDQRLQWDDFIGRVFALCPYHVSKGQEHWHSARQRGGSAFLSGKYSNDRTPQERWQLKSRSADDLDWAWELVSGFGFTIS